MTHVTYRLTAKNRDQLRNPTLEYGLALPLLIYLLPIALAGNVMRLVMSVRSGVV